MDELGTHSSTGACSDRRFDVGLRSSVECGGPNGADRRGHPAKIGALRRHDF